MTVDCQNIVFTLNSCAAGESAVTIVGIKVTQHSFSRFAILGTFLLNVGARLQSNLCITKVNCNEDPEVYSDHCKAFGCAIEGRESFAGLQFCQKCQEFKCQLSTLVKQNFCISSHRGANQLSERTNVRKVIIVCSRRNFTSAQPNRNFPNLRTFFTIVSTFWEICSFFSNLQ